MGNRKRGKPSYTPAPQIDDPKVAERLQAVVQVMSGETTVSDAARLLDMPRNYFQTVLHRGQAGLLEGLTPKPAGRHATPPAQQTLMRENQQLRHQLQQTEQRVAHLEKLLETASELIKEQIRANPPRGMGPRKPRKRRPPPDDSG